MLARHTVSSAQNLEDGGGFRLTSEPERTKRSCQNLVCIARNRLGCKHLRAEMLVQTFQPCCGVRRVADDAVQKPASASGVSHVNVAIMQSHPRLEMARTMLLSKTRDDISHFNCRVHSLVTNGWRANGSDPSTHNHVGAKLHHVDIVALQRLRQGIEICVHKNSQLLRGFRFSQRDKVGHIGRQASPEHNAIERSGVDLPLA